MKRLAIILSLSLSLPFRPQCQTDSCGIYLTGQDYKTGKLTYGNRCNSSRDKLKLHDSFSGKYIDVVHGDTKTHLCKDSIFGYRDCKGIAYRFYKSYDKEYRIEDTNQLVIYSAYISVPPSNVKHFQFYKKYFFSVSYCSPIYPLTILNLKRAFPDNLKFHDLLDITFGSNEPLYEYDATHAMYKISYLLSKSINKH